MTKHQSKKNPSTLIGVIYALLASFFFANSGLAAKFASVHASTEMMIWSRQAIGFLGFLPILLIDIGQKGTHTIKTHKLSLYLGRAMVTLVAGYCYFFAISQLPLADAVLLNYTRPLWIPLLVWVFLGKKIERTLQITLVAGFLGIVLILKPDQYLFQTASMAGLLSGLLSAIAALLLRRLAKVEPANRIIFYYFLLSSIFASIPLIWLWETPDIESAALLLVIGMFAVLYQMVLTRAYRAIRASIVNAILYISLAISILYDWIFWERPLDWVSILGMLLVGASCIIAVLKARPSRRQKIDDKGSKA